MKVILDFQGFKRVLHWNVKHFGEPIKFQVYKEMYTPNLLLADPLQTTADEPSRIIMLFEYHGDHLDPNTEELIPLYRFRGFDR